MKLILTYILIVFYVFLSAQPNSIFKKHFLSGTQNAYSNGVIETTPNNYILIGSSHDTLNGSIQWRLTLAGLDQNGELSWRKSYGNDNFNYSNYLYKPARFIKKGNFLYAALLITDSLQKQGAVLIKFDYNGDTIWQKKYYSPNDELFITEVTTSVDNGFLLTGAIQTSTPGFNGHPIVGTYLIKTDVNGTKLWEKKIYFPDLDLVQVGYSVLQDSTSKKIIIAGIQSNSTQFSNLLVLDSLGNYIYQNSMSPTFGSALVSVIKTKDNNYIGVGTMNHPEIIINGIEYARSLLIKFDINGTIIYKKEFDTSSVVNWFNNILELDDGSLITFGIYETLMRQGLGINDINCIMKIDSNGNLIWKKYFDNYTDNHNQDAMGGMNITYDGYLIFTNFLSNGFEPASTPYTFYKTDTSFCDINSISCYDFTGVEKHEFSERKIKCYPNPAHNYCIVALSELDSYKTIIIEIENSIGLILDRISTNTSVNYMLNTSEYQEGMYFITVSQNNQTIGQQKLIIVK